MSRRCQARGKQRADSCLPTVVWNATSALSPWDSTLHRRCANSLPLVALRRLTIRLSFPWSRLAKSSAPKRESVLNTLARPSVVRQRSRLTTPAQLTPGSGELQFDRRASRLDCQSPCRVLSLCRVSCVSFPLSTFLSFVACNSVPSSYVVVASSPDNSLGNQQVSFIASSTDYTRQLLRAVMRMSAAPWA